MNEFLENDLKRIEIAFENYHNSEDGDGNLVEELNFDIYLILNNGEKFNFPLSQLYWVNYQRQVILLRANGSFHEIAFSNIKRIVY